MGRIKEATFWFQTYRNIQSTYLPELNTSFGDVFYVSVVIWRLRMLEVR